MFERMRAGWRLGSAVRKQIFRDKGLLSYVILSTLIILAEAGVIFGSFIFISLPGQTPTTASSNQYVNLEFVLLLLLFYIAATFTAAYVLLALFIAFKNYASGTKIGMREALAKTSEYSGLILEWALFYSILIMILRVLESRFRGLGGAVIGSVAGVALSIGVMFALPVIYEQRVGPVEAMKRSAGVFINHFGSSVGGIAYSDLYGLGIMLIGVLISVALLFISAVVPFGIVFLILGLVGLLISIVLGASISSTTSNIFKLLLYDYASGRGLPSWLDEDLIKAAIVQKKGHGGNVPQL